MFGVPAMTFPRLSRKCALSARKRTLVGATMAVPPRFRITSGTRSVAVDASYTAAVSVSSRNESLWHPVLL
ncbi:MAG: hypothetical protein ABS52_08260 [Gemmatimonadetes bacterium SCN 70-22]|nr:MAG: hypothetical protein ABS52_08260 [Gemmatimonadetes bacterium SCN 70-22]